MTKSLWQRMTKRVADQWRNLAGQREKHSRSKLTGIEVLYGCCISSLVLGHTSDTCLALLFRSCLFKTDRHCWSAFKLAVFWQSPKGLSLDKALSVPAMLSPTAQPDTLSFMANFCWSWSFAFRFYSYLLSFSWITSLFLFQIWISAKKKINSTLTSF